MKAISKRVFVFIISAVILVTSLLAGNLLTTNALNVYEDTNPDEIINNFTVITSGSYYEGKKSTGTIEKTDNGYNINTNSYVAWFEKDDIAFGYKRYDVGASSTDNITCEVTVNKQFTLADNAALHTNASSGIMFRDSIDETGAYVYVHCRSEEVMVVYRSKKGDVTSSAIYSGVAPKYPVKLKIVKSGKAVTSYFMNNGSTKWIKIGTCSPTFSGPVYAGLASHSCDYNVPIISEYENFTAVGEGTWESGDGASDGSGTASGSGGSTDTEEQLPGEAPADPPVDDPAVLLRETFSDGSRVKGDESVTNPIWKKPSGILKELEDKNRVWFKDYDDTQDFIGNDDWSDYSSSVDFAFSPTVNSQDSNKFIMYVRHKEYVTYGVADYGIVVEAYNKTNSSGTVIYDSAGNTVRGVRVYIGKRERAKMSGALTVKSDYYYVPDDWFGEDNNGVFHNIYAECFDNKITVYVDGIYAVSYTDTDLIANNFGKIGFETLGNSCYIDNILVTALEDLNGGCYDNWVGDLWDRPEPQYIKDMGIPYYDYANDDILSSFKEGK